jgi:hypothetical protein
MKWEYKVAHFQAVKWTRTGLPKDLGKQFDQWGAEGWDLVRVEPILRSGFLFLGIGKNVHTDAFVAFFKRPME